NCDCKSRWISFITLSRTQCHRRNAQPGSGYSYRSFAVNELRQERNMKRFATLVSVALALTLMVIALGAYTRLTDAGLGCPDWPGCYGKFHAPLYDHHIAAAQEQYPHLEVDPYKARNEMLHRYIAGILGLAVLAIFIGSCLVKRYRALASALLLLVVFQAALGMWTVTLNLLPLIVLAHLLGGFSLFCLLALLRAEIA